MSVRSSQSITVEFVTSSFSTGAATTADSLPTGTLVLNGTDNAATVTVTNVDAGRYKAAVTLPTLSIGDVVELYIAATVGGVAGKGIVWRDSKDVLLDSSGDVTFNNTTIATATSVTNAVTVAANNDKTGYSLSVAPPTAAQVATQLWQDLTSGSDFTTAGSIGKLLVTQLDTNVGSRLPTSSYTTPPTTGQIASAVMSDVSDTVGADVVAILAQTNKLAFDGSNNVKAVVEAYASGEDPAALVLDVAASGHDTAGTIGALINSAGGAADPLANVVQGGSYAQFTAGWVLGRILASPVTYVGPSSPLSGQVQLRQGDSYPSARGRAQQFNNPGSWPDLTGATVNVLCYFPAGVQSFATTVPVPSGASANVLWQPTAAQTAGMPAGTVRLDLVATWPGSQADVATIAVGSLVVSL